MDLPASSEWFLHRKKRTIASPRSILELVAYYLALIFLVYYVSFFHHELLGDPWGFLYFLIFQSLAYIPALMTARRVHRNPPEFTPEALRRFGDVRATIRIYVNGVQIGEDKGMVGFEGDHLFFAGLCSSFALGSQDIDFKGSSESRFCQSPTTVYIRIRHPKVNLAIYVIGAEAEAFELRTRLREFRETPASQQRRSFPPIERQKPDRTDKGRFDVNRVKGSDVHF